MNKKHSNTAATATIFAFVITLFSYFSATIISSQILQFSSLFIVIAIGSFIAFTKLSSNGQTIKNSDENKLNDCNRRIARVGKEINNQAGELAINSAEVSFFLGKLSSDIESSSDDVDRLANAAEHMSSNTKEINDNAAVASEQSSRAMEASTSGFNRLSQNMATVQALNVGVNDASEKIKTLEQKASEIQSITDVINSISGQTNLLALNAAIEAARAGEQGRGFAVVADEVRALASKTADATAQIGEMLNQISQQTIETNGVMSNVVTQTSTVVATMDELSASLTEINSLMENSSNASEQISNALQHHDTTATDISHSIANLHDFLVNKSKETLSVSEQASVLSNRTEAIFVHLSEFKTDSLIEIMSEQAQSAAKEIGKLFEKSIGSNSISQQNLFNFNYQEITNTNPKKFSTSFDKFTDKVLPKIQEPLLNEFKEMIYAGAVDINGYFPTHNNCFSQALTGNYDHDFSHNRTKRMFNDPTGIRCGQHTKKFLLQTYKRDTGEIMHDVSAPIIVNGKHWGGFRIGFKAQTT